MMNNIKERIKELSEGNPGALRILVELISGGLIHYITILEDLNIRGDKIWELYKDSCGEDIEAMKRHLIGTTEKTIEMVTGATITIPPDGPIVMGIGSSPQLCPQCGIFMQDDSFGSYCTKCGHRTDGGMKHGQ